MTPLSSSIPKEMRAVEVITPGGPEAMKVSTQPTPFPERGEVLIKVAAAGINRPDILQRKGYYPPPPGASPILGLEVSGTIVALGEDVTDFQIGEEICCLLAGGGYAEYCVAPIEQCWPIPKGLTFVEAASLPETFFTVWSNVFERGKLGAGEILFVQGGSSGIGITAIQLATVMGYEAYTSAGSDEKCRACESLGAKRAINYKTEDFVSVVKEETGGKGVDVILDIIGGDYVPRELQMLSDEGRLVIIGTMGGSQTTLNLRDILIRRLTITGSTLRPRPVEFKKHIAHALKKNIWPLLTSGKIKPVVYQTFSLENVADAHRLMESSEHIGKIILTL